MYTATAIEIIGFTFVYVMTFLFGICAGSFLNVCIYRLPKGESIVKSGSHCMSCGASIKKRDLIPLFSWLALRGKCRSCGAPISPRYMLVEALTGILFVLTVWRLDFFYAGFIYPAVMCIFICCLIAAGFEDFDTCEISIGILAIMALTAVLTRILSLTGVINDGISLIDGLIGMASVSLPFLLLGFVFTPIFYKVFISENHKSSRRLKKRLKKTESISSSEKARLEKKLSGHLAAIKENGPVYGFGMGDIFLMSAGGLMLGWKSAVFAAFAAIITGGAYALIKARRSKNRSENSSEDENSTAGSNSFAFGPFLAAGLIMAVFFGETLVDMYINYITIPK